jgi:sugar transferase EpsL
MRTPVYDSLKRGLDFLGALGLGTILLPLFLVAGGLIRLIDGKPIFFTQVRPGKDGVPFKIYKFRTMTVGPPRANLISERARVTKLGLLLRAFSIDELPQLWNVFRGDMSFVGPRPLLMQYLPLYDNRQSRRHEVRPGLSGLAQVQGRNHLSWEEKFELDVRYVEGRSFRLDFFILMKSLWVVFLGRGVAPEREEWVEPFTGSTR